MKTYKIPCGWEVYGYLEIEAESLEDAVEIAESDDTNLPTKSSYTEGSFWVDRAEIDDDTVPDLCRKLDSLLLAKPVPTAFPVAVPNHLLDFLRLKRDHQI